MRHDHRRRTAILLVATCASLAFVPAAADEAAAPKRFGSLAMWFDPEMSRVAAPARKRDRQKTYGDAAIQTCLSTAQCLLV